MKKIVFVCTGNTCRSTMAHHYMQEKVKKLGIQDDYLIDSCGIYASSGDMATNMAITTMKNYDVNLEKHRSKNILELNLNDYDLIICMTTTHKDAISYEFPNLKDKVFTLKEYVNKDTPNPDIKDPFGNGIDEYNLCSKEIVYYVDELLKIF